ncbi:RadC family protein [Limnochorda pilosa]|nr:DNA repair protein RadC [Limnochorda pilosa]
MRHRMSIRELPESLRPRERLRLLGPEALTDQELLAILLGTGSQTESALDLARRILAEYGAGRPLAEASVEELNRIPGVGLAKAAQVRAALELGRRWSGAVPERIILARPEAVAAFLRAQMAHLDREQFRVLLLDARNRLMHQHVVALGGLDSAPVHPREVFKEAIKRSAAAVILAHNHPSGDPEPSDPDLGITRRLCRAGEILGIDVADHIVVAQEGYVSFRARGLLDR